MFENLKPLDPDPILGLINEFKADESSLKVDLGVGVYRNEQGKTPILEAVREAEQRRIREENTKEYLGGAGEVAYNQAMIKLLFGTDSAEVDNDRVRAVQTPGGCGALRVLAEFLVRCNPDATIWVSNPTWANHMPLLGEAGLKIREYPYYNYETHSIDFDEMMETLSHVGKGDLVLLHGCCHNPCGADLDETQWHALAKLANLKGFTPFIDIAYQGFGDGVEEDAIGVRVMANHVEEMVVAQSCSKNFGLYRERVGTAFILSKNTKQADIAYSQLLNVIRGMYSMPPAHGAAIVRRILEDEALKTMWMGEVAEMRHRIKTLRVELVKGLAASGFNRDFSFIERERGMFSFLGLDPEQVAILKKEHSIYMLGSSRVSIAGLNAGNMQYVLDSITKVLKND
ncbi:MAG: aspartate/tyrosine/aromatic aminotransferase [Sphingomonadales bacterium]|nr:aspartate/tyrosine/aromatic aminotransferase [Sphingomonadales bacterium]